MQGSANLNVMMKAARAAGRSLVKDFGEVENLQVSSKGAGDFVSRADVRAEEIVREALTEARPTYGFLGEEGAEIEGEDPTRRWVVDPLDGTKEFINKRGEFTVNIGIIENGVPVMGVVYAPALNRLFVADSRFSAWQATAEPGADVPPMSERSPLQIRRAPDAGLTAIASKSHRSDETNAFLETQNIGEIISAGSSLKFCLIAAGEADLYPRLGRTMEWDTAAGQAVAEAAGAKVTETDGTPLLYGKKARGYDNPHFIVWGDVSVPSE